MKKIFGLLIITFLFNLSSSSNAQPIGDIRYIDVPLEKAESISRNIENVSIFKLLWSGGTWNGTIPESYCDRQPNDEDCQEWTPWAQISTVVSNVMGYDDCCFAVAYKYRRCRTSNLFQLNIVGWSAEWSWWDDLWGNNCDQFKHDLESLPAAQRAYMMLEFEKALYEKISRALFVEENNEHRNNTYPQQNILCDENGDPTAPLPFKVFYTQGSCSSILSVKVQYNNEPSKLQMLRLTLSCEDVACCKHWNSYCFDNKGNMISKSGSDGPTAQSCNGYLSQEQINKVLESLEKFNVSIANWATTPCTPSCSEHMLK